MIVKSLKYGDMAKEYYYHCLKQKKGFGLKYYTDRFLIHFKYEKNI